MKNYKAIIITVLVAVFNSMTARAAISTPTQVAIDGDTYVLNLTEKVATLKKVNADKFGENKVYNIPSSISYRDITYSVDTIGTEVFRYESLRKVTIPSNVSLVKTRAFENAKIDSLIIEDSTVELKTDWWIQDDGWAATRYSSFGGQYNYIYSGRYTEFIGYVYSCFYPPHGPSETRYNPAITKVIDIGPNLESIDLYGLNASTVNVLGSDRPVEFIELWDCENLNINRNFNDLRYYKWNQEAIINLKTLSFGNHVTTLPKGLITSFPSLTTIKISKSLIDFDPYEIKLSKRLRNLEIEEGNKAYAFVDDILYNGDITKMYFMFNPTGKTYDKITLPNTITSIPDSMFYRLNCDRIEAQGVTEVGKSAFFYSTIKELVTDGGLKSISAEAFSGCNNLETIKLDKSITEIPDYAFSWCRNCKFDDDVFTNLSKIGKAAFTSCYGITNLKLSNLSELGESAFSSIKVTTVEINGPITTIPYSAFKASSLESIKLPDNIESIDRYALSRTKLKSIVLPKNLREIGESAFESCESLETVVASDKLSKIGYDAFKDCTKLTLDDSFFNNIEQLKSSAFMNCIALNNNVVFNNLSEIGQSCFDNTHIKSITFGGTMSDIDSYTTKDCPDLEALNFNSKLDVIYRFAFIGCPKLESIVFNDYVFALYSSAFGECSNIKKLEFNGSVTYIGDEVFNNCRNLTEINLGEHISTIGDNAFKDCRSLTKIDFGDGIKEIGKSAFESCDLRNIRLGSALRSVGDGAFNRNFNLENVYCNSTLAPEAYDNSFLEGYDATLHVPMGARQRYMIAPGWRYFASIVQDESLSDVDEVTVDGEDVPVEYYDMQGRRVENPVHGIYIKRQGSKVEKVVL